VLQNILVSEKRKTLAMYMLRALLINSLICFGSILTLFAQEDPINFNITNVHLSNEQLHVFLTIKNQGNLPIHDFNVVATETIERPVNLEIISFDKLEKGNTGETLTILFLIDISGSMNRHNRLELAKNAVKEAVEKVNLPANTSLLLATFHDDLSDDFPINKSNVNKIIEEQIKKGRDTDLYNSIIQKTNDFKSTKGKKAIVLLSDGKDESNLIKKYDLLGLPRPTANDAIETVKDSTLRDNFFLFPIALPGADTVFLKDLVAATPSPFDKYTDIEDANTKLGEIFIDIISSISADYLVRIKPQKRLYYGRERTLSLDWAPLEENYTSSFNYREGTYAQPIAPLPPDAPLEWYKSIFSGILLIGLLFLLLYFGVPKYKKTAFSTKYIKTYQAKKGIIHTDPLTNDRIEEGEKVVHKCGTPITLASWKFSGKCPHFPNCINNKLYNCNGKGGPENYDLFAQNGILKKLTWGWYGGLGGLIAWLLFSLHKLFNFGASTDVYDNMHQSILGVDFLKKYNLLASEVGDATFIGLALGAGICLTLAIAEEKSSARFFSKKRILLRLLVGIIASFLIFFVGVLFQYVVLDNPFWSGLLTWIIFGISIGLVLSIQSTILWQRGIAGGVIASVIGFFIYYFISSSTNSLYIKMLSLIAIGIILGIIIVVIISHLEDFQLRVLEPILYSGHTYPISKWLKSGIIVEIGTDKACYVFIKWDDPHVNGHHAELTYDNTINTVYIQPINDAEILVNSVIIPLDRRTPLAHNDHIRLGRNSITTLQYEEKRTNETPIF